MRLKDSFHPYAFTTILFWSLAYVLTRLTLRYFSAFSLGFLRYITASAVLLIIVLTAKIKLPERTDIKWFLLSGFFGFFLYMIAFNKGCKVATAATSSVVIATVPVITALFARVIYQEKMDAIQLAATAVEFTGVIVLTLLDGAFSLNIGLSWLFLAAISLSAYNLLQRRLTKKYSGLQTSAYSIFAGTVMLSVFMPASVGEARNAPHVQVLYILILGVFSSAIAYAAWAQAFKKAEHTSSVSNYMFITPFLTAVLGFVLAGETPDLPTAVGGAIIMTGVLIFNFGEKIHNRAFQTKNHL